MLGTLKKMNEKDKIETVEFFIGITGWVFMILGIVHLLGLATDVFHSQALSKSTTYLSPLFAMATFFIGRGIRNRTEWIRSLAVLALVALVCFGLPYAVVKGYCVAFPLRVSASLAFYLAVLFFLTRRTVKEVFRREQERACPTVGTNDHE